MEFASGMLSSGNRCIPTRCCRPSLVVHPSGVFLGGGRDGAAEGFGVTRSRFDQGLLRSGFLRLADFPEELLLCALSEDEMGPPLATVVGPRLLPSVVLPPCSSV